jgi:hypothetical protein
MTTLSKAWLPSLSIRKKVYVQSLSPPFKTEEPKAPLRSPLQFVPVPLLAGPKERFPLFVLATS